MKRHQWWLGGVGLLVVFLICNNQLLSGSAVANWDGDGYFFPYYVLVADFIREGRLLLWDPWSNGGVPILGDPQVGALSPLTLLVTFLTGGSSRGFVLYWLLMWWLGGAGLLLLARHLRAPLWGAAAVTLGYLFCGVYTGNAEYTSWIVGFSFLPLVVWRLDVAVLEGRLLPAVQAGALWGLSAMAGYPAFAVMTGLYCALWALGRVVTAGRRAGGADATRRVAFDGRGAGRRVAFAAAAVALVAVVGLLVLSPTYLAFFVEGRGYHERVGALPRNLAISGNDLAPGALATLASPYPGLLKYYYPNELFLGTDLSSVSVYTGAVAVALALFALAARPGDRWRWWLALLGLFTLAVALGDALPVRGVLYDVLVPMRYFRHSSLVRAYFVFSLAVLALIGSRDLARALAEGARGAWTRFLAVSGVAAVVAIGVLVAFVAAADVPDRPFAAWGFAHVSVVWLGLCGVALFGRYGDGGAARRIVPALVIGLALADVFFTSLISSTVVMNTDPRAVRKWEGLDRAHKTSTDLTQVGQQRTETPCGNVPCKTNDQLVTKVPAFNAFSTEKNPVHARMVDDAVLRAAATGQERTWFAREVARAGANDEVVDAFFERSRELGAPPLVVTPRDALVGEGSVDAAAGAVSSLPAAERVPTSVAAYTPTRLELRVTAPADGWLLVTDRWARGWTAEVNGAPTPVDAGNFLFRAVPVRAGENTVAFTYHPYGVPWLVALSWGTLLATGIATVLVASRRRRREETPGGGPAAAEPEEELVAVTPSTASPAIAPPRKPARKQRRRK